MMNSQARDASLAVELPYWDFLEEPFAHAVLTDGSLVSGLDVELLDIECFSEDQVNQFTASLRSALNSLSEGTSLQFHLRVGSDFSQMIEKHVEGRLENCHSLVERIAEHREEKLRAAMDAGELYRPRLSIFLRTPMQGIKQKGLFKKEVAFLKDAESVYGETLELLAQSMDGLASSLASAGIESSKLTREEILACIYRFMNPRRASTEPAPHVLTSDEMELPPRLVQEADWLANQSPREQLVFGDLILSLEHFTLDCHYHRVVTLKTLPEVTVAGQLAGFMRLPFHYDLLLSLEVPPQADEMARLQRARRMAHSMAATQSGRASDLESETKLSSTEELIRELLATGQRIYAAQLSIVVKEPANPEGAKKLQRKVREVLSRFRALQGAEGLEESVGAWKIVKGNLPVAPVDLQRKRKMKTNNLADFLPVYGPREGDRNPVVVFRNRMNGLVGFDAFDAGLPNYNSLVTGSSGAGKSFLNNCILLQELAKGMRVFIIDIGGSYKKLTEALGGQYIEVDLSDKYRINPFHLNDPSQEPSNQKVKSLLACVESMVAEDEKAKLPKLDRVLLEKAILETFEEKRRKNDVPVLSDLMEHLKASDEPSMRDLAKILFMWTGKRPYGCLLDGVGALRTDASVCAFDLKGLSSHPDLQAVMILILTDFILAQVDRDKENRKRIILDEAWELLKSPAAASFMEYCARTLRKTGSGITFITQGVEEIVASPIGSAILNSTATKFVMLQRGDSQVLAEALKLNSQELRLIDSLEQRKGEFSEGFMIKGDHRQVVRIFPSPFEYWLSTSDPEDKRYLNGLESDGLTLVEAIERAAREYPNGAQGERKEVA